MIENLRPRVDSLPSHSLKQPGITADVLRLDLVHSLISGNKWYKLKKYLQDARAKSKTTILTFGGAFSNHILATAAACKEYGLSCAGIIRGEKPAKLSQTLLDAAALGMDLIYVSREDYKLKKIPDLAYEKYPSFYLIPEGGYGVLGMEGAKNILAPVTKKYTHILAAVGTGTTLAGLIEASTANQQIIGISALKNYFDLPKEINLLLSSNNEDRFEILHDYSFAGYAKHNQQLLQFMNDWFRLTSIPSDFVYTGKLFYAFEYLCDKGFFPENSDILLIHSGGLQGNRSLPKGTLIF